MSALAPVRNVLKVWLVLLGLCAILGLIGYGIGDGDYRVVSSFVFCGLLLGLAAYLSAERMVLGMLGARELPAGQAPDLHSSVERLSVRAGVVKPRIYVIEKGPPLALAAGRGVASSAIALTEALLLLPSPAEVEAVIAHELAHIRRRDVLVQSTAVMLGTTIVETSRIGGFLSRALLFVLGPVASAFVHLLLSVKREFEADALADGRMRAEERRDALLEERVDRVQRLGRGRRLELKQLCGLLEPDQPVRQAVRRLAQ